MEKHDFIALKATQFIKRLHGCLLGAVNFCGINGNEIVDGIAFKGNGSFLIEAKVSKSDFYADAKKEFRINPEKGVGKYRYYACPIGLLTIDDLPPKWGLIYVDDKGKCELIKGYGAGIRKSCICTNHGDLNPEPYVFERNLERENEFLLYIAKRYKEQKHLDNII